MIVDCHAHVANQLTGFWRPLRHGRIADRGRVRQIFPPSFDPPASPPEVLLGYMDQAGVDRTFLVQHHLYGDQNATVLDAVRRWPDRFVGFAYLGALDQPDAPDQIERLIEAGMAGLKVEVASTRRLRESFRFDGEREWRVWERLNALRRPLVLDVNDAIAEDVPAVRRLIEELEHVHTLICHLGGRHREGWEERALLGKHPRAWVDLAALPLAFGPDEEYPYPRAQKLVRWAVDTFGAGKVVWGTDYPVLLNAGTYRQLLDFVRRHCEFLSPEQKEEVLGGAALRFLKPS